jgi:hypothetical protein
VSLAADVCTHLASVGALSLTAGQTLFAVPFPEGTTSDQAVSVVEYAGSEDEHAAGASLSRPLYETTRFQVVCRDAEDKAATAEALARSISLNLNRLAETTVGNTKFLTVKRLSRPFYLSQDSNNRHRYVTNFEAVVIDTGST